MKQIKIWLLVAMTLVMPLQIEAQSVQITKFERNYTSLIASMNQVVDNAGDACAVIRFWYSGEEFIIEPNLGVLKKEEYPGETRLWVPKGTKRITIRHKNDKPLRGYAIPIQVESKTDYDADISILSTSINTISRSYVYLNAGYNIMSLSGPSVAIGANMKHHQIELGVIYGLNKTDSLFFYGSDGDLLADLHYNAIKVGLTYGYEIPVSDFLSITPMIGGSYNAYIGKESSGISKNSNYKNGNSISAGGGLRLTVALSNRFKLCVTPEYQAAVYKDETCKLVSKYDDNLKKWHTGFNLNVGLMIVF